MVNSVNACLMVSNIRSTSISSIFCLTIFSIAERMTVLWPEANCNMYNRIYNIHHCLKIYNKLKKMKAAEILQ